MAAPRLSAQSGVMPIVAMIKGLLQETASGVCTFMNGDKVTKVFVTGTSLFFIQPNFKDFPSRKIEMRDSVGSYLETITSISNVSSMTYVPYDTDGVFERMLKWAAEISQVDKTYKTKVRMLKVSLEQWIVINEIS